MEKQNQSDEDQTVSQALAADYPRLAIPSALRSAVAQALIDGQTHYTDARGVPTLRKQLAAALASDTPDDILLVSGEQEARFLAIQALQGSGAVVALPEVVHPGAPKAAALRGPEPLRFDAQHGPDGIAGAVGAALAGGASAIYLENPVRLSGRLLDHDQLAAVAQAIVAAGATAVCDEGLAGWLRPGAHVTSLASLPGMAGRTLLIGTPWPGLGLEHAGVAYLTGPTELIAKCLTLKQTISICTSTLTQWMIDGGGTVQADEHAARMSELLELRREAEDAARRAGAEILPGDVSAILALRAGPQLAARLAAAHGSAIDGAAWGAPGVVRLTLTPAKGNG